MGAGFIMGGYCPGTSFCGASIGKIDALVFIGGLFIGVMIFGFGFKLWNGLYMAKFMGIPKVSTFLGLSDGFFVLLVIIAALIMFRVAEWAEQKFPREEY